MTDFAPGDVIVRAFKGGTEHRDMVVAGDDGSVRTARGKVRYRTVDADGNFTSQIQTAWWRPGRYGCGDWYLER